MRKDNITLTYIFVAISLLHPALNAFDFPISQQKTVKIQTIDNRTDDTFLLIAIPKSILSDQGTHVTFYNNPAPDQLLPFLQQNNIPYATILPHTKELTSLIVNFDKNITLDSSNTPNKNVVLYNMNSHVAYYFDLEIDKVTKANNRPRIRDIINPVPSISLFASITNMSAGEEETRARSTIIPIDLNAPDHNFRYIINYIIEDPMQNSEIEIDGMVDTVDWSDPTAYQQAKFSDIGSFRPIDK